MFGDSDAPGLRGTHGSRPAAVRDNRHDSAYIFGAICPACVVGAAIVMPWIGSEVGRRLLRPEMTIHLAEIGKQVSANAHMTPGMRSSAMSTA